MTQEQQEKVMQYIQGSASCKTPEGETSLRKLQEALSQVQDCIKKNQELQVHIQQYQGAAQAYARDLLEVEE